MSSNPIGDDQRAPSFGLSNGEVVKPKLSHTIWFAQRTGSTLLCKTLEARGIAGGPDEWFDCSPDLLDAFHMTSHAELQDHVWKLGTTANGVFGIHHSFHEPHFGQLLKTLARFPNCPQEERNRTAIWECAFPNHRHIFLTRHNKVRLAVSWWKAIQSQLWHLQPGENPRPVDLSNSYAYDDIDHLYNECSMREDGTFVLYCGRPSCSGENHDPPLGRSISFYPQ